MTGPDRPMLVVGIGNILLRDDGVGAEVVRAMGRLVAQGTVDLPTGTELVDGGTLGLDLLPLLSTARAVVFVDAMEVGRTPGSVEVRRLDPVGEAPAGLPESNRSGIGDLVAAAWLMAAAPARITLVGIQPGEIGVGLELTGAVRAAIPEAIDRTLGELNRLASVTSSPGAGRLSGDHAMAGVGA